MVAYKLVKAAIELLLGLILLVLVARVTHGLGDLVRGIRDHATAAWSLALADDLARVVTRRHVVVVALASILDGFVSSFEGWALHKRYAWSEWLVVAATSCFVPFELGALARHVTGGRVLLLCGNALIVAYLARRLSRRTKSAFSSMPRTNKWYNVHLPRERRDR
jgi:uncharacterized membrane protein (DUF2068 family)